ncbi:MAG: hypothetical protein WBA13_19840 [Microcoleaceae cyanobacterium]
MISEQECLTVYDQLLDILKEFNLDWVIEQVNDIISEGKVLEQTVSGRKSPDLKLAYFSPKEQLLLLISAIEQVGLNTVEFEGKIQAALAHEMKVSQLQPEICFTYPLEKQEKKIKFIPESLSVRQAHAQQLQALLNQLKQEII